MPLAVVSRKFSPPNLPKGYVARPRLIELLAEGLRSDKQVTIIKAGPGTGKSVLLAERFAISPDSVAWYGLTPADRDPVVFLTHLIESLRAKVPGLGRQGALVLESLGEGGLSQAAGILCDELASARQDASVVVVDDAQHLMDSGPGLESLETLIRFFPENCQLILSGRSLPPLKLAQHQIRGAVVTLTEDDLRMTRTEVAAMWAAAGYQEAPGAVSELYDRTRGWVTGIVYALADSISQNPVASLEKPEGLFEFLAQEVFDDLAQSFQQQLLICAEVPRLEIRMCKTVLGDEAESFWALLPQYPTLVQPQEEIWHFHPIFREFLQHLAPARLDRARRNEVLIKLARSGQLSPEQEVTFYQRAGDWDAAEQSFAKLVEPLVRSGRFSTLNQLLEEFPAQWHLCSPLGPYVRGEIARRCGNLGEAILQLEEAERRAVGAPLRTRIWSSLSAAAGARGELPRQRQLAELALLELAPSDKSSAALCQNSLGLYFAASNDMESARAAFDAAISLYHDAGDPAGELRGLSNLGLIAAQQGELVRAITYYREGLRFAEVAGVSPQPMIFNNLAMCELFLGRVSQACDAAERGMALAERLMAKRDRAYLRYTLGQIALRQHRSQNALEQFENCLQEATQVGDRRCQGQAFIGFAELALQARKLPDARAAIDRYLELLGVELVSPLALDAALVMSQIELQDRNFAAVEALLNQIDRDGGPDHYVAYVMLRIRRDLAHSLGDVALVFNFQRSLEDHAARFGLPPPEPGPDGQSVAPLVPVLDVTCLGPFSVKVDGREISARNWRTANAQVLLVYLLLHPAGATKEALVELLYSEDTATSTLHTVINRLRHALEPGLPKGIPSRFVLFQDGRYFINQGTQFKLDLIEFRQLFRQARASDDADGQRQDLLEQALKCYQGPFMESFPHVNWCQLEGENSRRMAFEAIEQLFVLAGAADDWVRLEGYADAALTLNRGFERAFRAKMVALAMQERTEDALRIEALALQVLANEFGTTLENETAELAGLIREGRLKVRAAREFLPMGW